MKQETLEEALLEDIKFLLLAKSDALAIRLIEKYGHNKQQERSYSKEEVLEHLNHLIIMRSSELDLYTNDEEIMTIKWFKQFKNK